jgi:vacuole morphology and inheritance protein 14
MTCRAVSTMSTRSKIGREDIKWQELLSHFRTVQAKHEKARRQAMGGDTMPSTEFSENEKFSDAGRNIGSSTLARPPVRRKVTGDTNPIGVSPRQGVLSPLNPRARGQSLLPSALAPPMSGLGGRPVSPVTVTLPPKQQQPRQAPNMGRKI